MPRILLIDDDDLVLQMLKSFFQRKDFDVVTAVDGDEGIEVQRKTPSEIVVTDILMPHKEGFETIRDLKAENPELKIVAISGGGRNHPGTYLEFARTFGADMALEKPLDLDNLLSIVNDLLEGKPVS